MTDGWGPTAIFTAEGQRSVELSDEDDGLGRPGEIVLGSAGADEQWSRITYSGPRRHRPDRGRQRPPRSTEHVEQYEQALAASQPLPSLDVPAPDIAADGDLTAVREPLAWPEREAERTDEPAETGEPAGTDESTGRAVAGAGSADRSLLRSSRTMAIASLASRLTGFLRSVALAAALGIATSRVADSYNLANSLPNMVYELLLGGVLSSVIIPLIVRAQEHDTDHGEAFTQRLLTWAVIVLGVATLLAVAAAPLLAAAYTGAGSQRQLISLFATLLLPEIFFYGLGAMFTAVLNTRGVYGPPAWAPVLNNVITIATIGVFAVIPGPSVLTEKTITNPQILVLGIGTTLGIAVQALVLVPYLRRAGFVWRWRLRASGDESARLSEVGRLGGWVLGYVVVSQIGVYLVNWVANRFRGGPSTFMYADLLFQVPYGVIGVSLLTALMPRMSRSAARGDRAGVVADLSLGARLSAVGLVPITFGLIALGPTLGTALFAYGRSDATDGRFVGVVLAYSAFGLLPFALVMLQLRVFYATRDARTPTLVNVAMVSVKVAVIVGYYTIVGGRSTLIALSFATSLSYLVGAVVGHALLSRRFGHLGFSAVGATVLRVGAASVVAAGAAAAIVFALRSVLGGGGGAAAVILVVAGLAGVGVLVVMMRVVRVAELPQIVASLRR